MTSEHGQEQSMFTRRPFTSVGVVPVQRAWSGSGSYRSTGSEQNGHRTPSFMNTMIPYLSSPIPCKASLRTPQALSQGDKG